ncbi:MAG: hemerythrin family protein [Desulfamplus sp.]|nr:hemerythrin family protein [Desulfamplus sp.]
MERRDNHNVSRNNSYAMLDLQWKEEYNTGIAEIDYQHQYFLSLIKRITTVMAERHDHTYCQRLFTELVYYTRFHFYSEENIMMHYNYTGFKEHQEIHRDLIDLLTNKINSIAENMDEYHQFVQFLLKWFVHHSMEEDKKIASCMTSDLNIS